MNLGTETEHVEHKRSTSEMREAMEPVASILNKYALVPNARGVARYGDVHQLGDHVREPVQVEGRVHGEHRLRVERARHGVGVGAALVGVQAAGDLEACVAARPMRVIEFGDVDELAKKYEGQRIATEFPALDTIGEVQPSSTFAIKHCMLDENFDKVIL